MAIANLGRVKGESAYETWGKSNPDGTEEEFLESLKGPKGDPGESGASSWAEVSGKPFSSVDGYTLVVEDGTLRVNTTDEASRNDGRPITSAGVHSVVGNIEALLGTI